MPCTVSVSAFSPRALGANQWLPYQVRIVSRIGPSAILIGSNAAGRMGALMSSCAMSEGEPQKSQRCATRVASKTEMAFQLWQRTVFFSAAQPR